MDDSHVDALARSEVLALLRSLPIDTDPARFVLDFARHADLPVKAMAEQLDLRFRAAEKFPEWAGTDLLYTRRSLEQSSGPIAARHKGAWLRGRVIDLCGGFGSDLLHNREGIDSAVYCDTDPVLCKIFAHNASVLGFEQVEVHHGDGIEYLRNCPDGAFDVVYADPDRRSSSGKRTVSLKESSPDITAHLDLLKAKARLALIKASPALDPTEAARLLPGLHEYSAVSVNGEVKEVLLFLENVPLEHPKRTAAVIHKAGETRWEHSGSGASAWSGGEPAFFAEPDPAIIRAGLASDVAAQFGLLHASAGSVYLLGDHQPAGFPGRVLQVEALLPANFRAVRRWCQENGVTAANIARRDFPQPPDVIRKSLKLGDGGDWYLFFLRFGDGYAGFACQRLNQK